MRRIVLSCVVVAVDVPSGTVEKAALAEVVTGRQHGEPLVVAVHDDDPVEDGVERVCGGTLHDDVDPRRKLARDCGGGHLLEPEARDPVDDGQGGDQV